MPRRAGLIPILALSVLMAWVCLVPLAAAASPRIATILVEGLKRIERKRFLVDLGIAEGDVYREGLEERLERQGRALSYVRDLKVEGRHEGSGVHISLWVREASRLQIRPYLTILDDGDLSGGFILDSTSLLGRSETWRFNLQVGPRAMLQLSGRDFDIGSWLPQLNVDLGGVDWDNPFWKAEQRQLWATGGPSLRLPSSGRLMLLGGIEKIETKPNRGIEPDGIDQHILLQGEWRQSILAKALILDVKGEMRLPSSEREYARGSAALLATRHQGRWIFSGRWESGSVNAWSPTHSLYYMDSWRYLWSYDAGSLPAREFHFLRLRGDMRLVDFGVGMRRGAPRQNVRASVYWQLQGAVHRLQRQDAFSDSQDYGIGLGFLLPTRLPSRLSLGIHWNPFGNSRSVLIIEDG